MGRAKLCDFRVQRKDIARQHVRFEWASEPHGELRVINLSSKNDIVFQGEFANRELVLGAGEWFAIGDTRFYVLSEEMRLALPRLIELLGSDYALIDDLMIAAIRDGHRPFVLVGERGCAAQPVAHTIHNISRRRHNGFATLDHDARPTAVTLQKIRNAKGGTIFVDVRQKGRLHSQVTASLTRDKARIHLIIGAPTSHKAAGSFPDLPDPKLIVLPAMMQRRDDIPHLLDKWASDEDSDVRFARLRPELREAIINYDWPENYDELFEFAEFLRHMVSVKEDTSTQVARDASVPRSTPTAWAKRLGIPIELPLMPDAEGHAESEDDSDENGDD